MAPATGGKGHAIVVGHGRVGQLVCDMLEQPPLPLHRHRQRSAAVSGVPSRAGGEVYYGDATEPTFLNSCGLAEAPAVVVTIHTQAAIDEIVERCARARPDLPIVSRARDARTPSHLYDLGVTDAVPETIEASLQLSEAALVGVGVPTGPVIASIHEKRDEFRHELQEAAGRAGRTGIRSIRAKTLRSS